MGILEDYSSREYEQKPRGSLYSQTRDNIEALESMGFQFSEDAESYPIEQYESWGHGLVRTPIGTRHSFILRGTGPNGQDVVYVRHETAARGAGQTLLYIDGKRYRVSSILRGQDF